MKNEFSSENQMFAGGQASRSYIIVGQKIIGQIIQWSCKGRVLVIVKSNMESKMQK